MFILRYAEKIYRADPLMIAGRQALSGVPGNVD